MNCASLIFSDWLGKDIHDGNWVRPKPFPGGDGDHPAGGRTPVQRDRGAAVCGPREKPTSTGLQGQRTVHGG